MSNEFDAQKALEALKSADFSYSNHVADYGKILAFDVPELNSGVKRLLDQKIRNIGERDTKESSLIFPIVGAAGSGKTHLLGHLLTKARESGAFFVAADLSSVSDLFLTLNSVIADTLSPESAEPALYRLVRNMALEAGRPAVADFFPAAGEPGAGGTEEIRDFDEREINNLRESILDGLFKKHRSASQTFEPVITDVLNLLAGDKNLFREAKSRLVDPDFAASKYGNRRGPNTDAVRIFSGLTWLMSLNGAFTILAIDQLDAILVDYLNSDERTDVSEEASPGTYPFIINTLSSDILAMYSNSHKTFSVMLMLGETWDAINALAIRSALGRFDNPRFMLPVEDAGILRKMVEKRLRGPYREHDFKPPFPTWPFSDDFFGKRVGSFPRDFLKACGEHVDDCVKHGLVFVTGEKPVKSLPPFRGVPEDPPFDEMDKCYNRHFKAADYGALKTYGEAFAFWESNLVNHAYTFRQEDLARQKKLDVIYQCNDEEIIIVNYRYIENIHERDLYVSAILARSKDEFSYKLRRALTVSGVNKVIRNRKLAVIVPNGLPEEEGSDELVPLADKKSLSGLFAPLFEKGGGWVNPGVRVRKHLFALSGVKQEFPEHYWAWAIRETPAKRQNLCNKELDWLVAKFETADHGKIYEFRPGEKGGKPGDGKTKETEDKSAGGKTKGTDGKPDEGKSVKEPRGRPGKSVPDGIYIGDYVDEDGAGAEPCVIDPGNMIRHVAVIGSSGSGKTVLLKRITEEASLQGMSAVVVDTSKDLVCLAEPWDAIPEKLSKSDRERTKRYFQNTEVIVWTPDEPEGNDFLQPLIPELHCFVDYESDLNEIIDRVIGNLEQKYKWVPTEMEKARATVLDAALRRMAKTQTVNNFGKLYETLKELDDSEFLEDAKHKFNKAKNYLIEFFSMEVRTDDNLLKMKEDQRIFYSDVSDLLESASGKPRISVISLNFMGSTKRQKWINDLAINVLSYAMKRKSGNPILLVIDEAKEFIPSGLGTGSKKSIKLISNTARKYGLGLIIAAQTLAGMDNEILSNCETKICGKQGSVAALKNMKELFEMPKADFGSLGVGEFYAMGIGKSSSASKRLIKTHLCHSLHPKRVPDQSFILEKAKASRERLTEEKRNKRG
ncbi:MAG: DUF853 family protein [Deltaproteobacteria bacterium]|jgi:predicted ATPase|nr:DUF853 family protein [Deltaproteobacteria bacterium]